MEIWYVALDVMLLCLPRLGEPYGACSLAPKGLGTLPLTKVTEEFLFLTSRWPERTVLQRVAKPAGARAGRGAQVTPSAPNLAW